ncbi:uncharacterized protein RAG0_06258 [Rhynchosporium agropyri]|uniref:Uncharacterized protein n=1 Tax=Rhynchosporium agropyri TaxID=914238 RepID=A0A1E1KGF2_9HELO|nr:uncharacterized protein RAG0_06258 [Rhynchosporium agropyri]
MSENNSNTQDSFAKKNKKKIGRLGARLAAQMLMQDPSLNINAVTCAPATIPASQVTETEECIDSIAVSGSLTLGEEESSVKNVSYSDNSAQFSPTNAGSEAAKGGYGTAERASAAPLPAHLKMSWEQNSLEYDNNNSTSRPHSASSMSGSKISWTKDDVVVTMNPPQPQNMLKTEKAATNMEDTQVKKDESVAQGAINNARPKLALPGRSQAQPSQRGIPPVSVQVLPKEAPVSVPAARSRFTFMNSRDTQDVDEPVPTNTIIPYSTPIITFSAAPTGGMATWAGGAPSLKTAVPVFPTLSTAPVKIIASSTNQTQIEVVADYSQKGQSDRVKATGRKKPQLITSSGAPNLAVLAEAGAKISGAELPQIEHVTDTPLGSALVNLRTVVEFVETTPECTSPKDTPSTNLALQAVAIDEVSDIEKSSPVADSSPPGSNLPHVTPNLETDDFFTQYTVLLRTKEEKAVDILMKEVEANRDRVAEFEEMVKEISRDNKWMAEENRRVEDRYQVFSIDEIIFRPQLLAARDEKIIEIMGETEIFELISQYTSALKREADKLQVANKKIEDLSVKLEETNSKIKNTENQFEIVSLSTHTNSDQVQESKDHGATEPYSDRLKLSSIVQDVEVDRSGLGVGLERLSQHIIPNVFRPAVQDSSRLAAGFQGLKRENIQFPVADSSRSKTGSRSIEAIAAETIGMSSGYRNEGLIEGKIFAPNESSTSDSECMAEILMGVAIDGDEEERASSTVKVKTLPPKPGSSNKTSCSPRDQPRKGLTSPVWSNGSSELNAMVSCFASDEPPAIPYPYQQDEVVYKHDPLLPALRAIAVRFKWEIAAFKRGVDPKAVVDARSGVYIHS